ncbi:23S rRNA (uracil(747)-C(5))-methyltransferase RlmC [Nocardioides sp. Leaf374]|uniref:23S rRNA (uracil(747)-C(5))-methyltransferase RlmC n=1 Tax=Nocardioides sp. Leaf374 TaxID=2876560 RepID=UPI001E5B3FEB|nr:23S rRNA (uracil(747)-C(5))-methyltransferase RlmC [Nocardioides sp. Leaf374]
MQCHHFDAGRCRSCAWMGQAYDDQVAAKQRHCRGLLAAWPDLTWLEPHRSREEGFRNKAKMVVAGTLEAPTLGILDPSGAGVDLRDCGLHEPGLAAALPALADFVTRAAVAPYDLATRRGELKHLLVTRSPDGELMVRFVLRSTEPVTRIRKHLPALHAALPELVVVSANVQPEHKAVLEGEREIALSPRETLAMRVNGLTLRLRPQGFFQTNTEVAAALYRQGRDWVEEIAPASVWDLYCGVGGFALHVAAPGRLVTGVEVSEEAVAAARATAEYARLPGLRFEAADATTWAQAQEAGPELVVLNPPRRGVGPELCAWLEGSGVGHVVYSSCNAVSLARDLAALPSFAPRRARLFDMFPQTTHHEVMVLLERR